jgi:hypothetical protein
MYSNTDGRQYFTDRDRAAFKKALTIYYSTGCSITDAFAQVESGLIDRYYRRKKKYPEEIEKIDAEARAATAEERSAQLTAFQSWQVMASIQIQKRASDILLTHLIPALERIAKGEPWDIWDEKTGETKPVPIYPRDQIQAMRLMKSIAKEGILPRGYFRESLPEEKKEEEHKSYYPPIQFVGAQTDWTSISCTKPDGEVITVHTDDTESDDVEQRVSRLAVSLPADG